MAAVNEDHARLCSSPEWATHLQTEVLPLVTAGVDLGRDMLEVGPGPGAATEWLHHRVDRLVVVEREREAADKLLATYRGTNVEVVHGDAAAMTFTGGSFDSAGSFTMLHHVPTVALQNTLLAEVLRVLRPGGVLVASDSRPSNDLHHFHEGDTYNPIEPATLIARLQTLGYDEITVRVAETLTFVARKPGQSSA